MSWDNAYGRSQIATWLIERRCDRPTCLGHVVYSNDAADQLVGPPTANCATGDDPLLRLFDAEARIFLEQAPTVPTPNPDARSTVVAPITEPVAPITEPVAPITEPVAPITEPVAPITEPVAIVVEVEAGRTAALHLVVLSCGRVLVQAVGRGGWDAVDRMLAEQHRFRSVLMELSELAHSTEDDDDFCQRLIERAIEIVPGAQGGSVQINVPGTTMFRFVAAVGYDLGGLQEHLLDHRVFFRDAWDPNARIVRDFEVAGRSAEITEWLMTVGRLSEIVVNVSGPVLADGFPVAFLSLDNYDDPDAMNNTSVEMTTVLSRLLGDLLRRRQLEAELRKEREAFRHLALHDPLTGLANRRSLERRIAEMLESAQQRSRPSSVLFVDIDDFKGVNDRLGHEAGDHLLVEVANGLSAVVGSSALAGRWGGDEFLVVPHDIDTPEQAIALAERVLSQFEVAIEVGDGRLHRARLSVGVGWSADSNADLDTLVRTADEALYQAKAAGKGVTRFRTV